MIIPPINIDKTTISERILIFRLKNYVPKVKIQLFEQSEFCIFNNFSIVSFEKNQTLLDEMVVLTLKGKN